MTKKKILLVEDEKELVMLMKIRLEAKGYEMIAAYDGEEGLRKVEEERPDLIMLDIVMPKMDGLTLSRKLKENPETKDIPIVVVSASGGKGLPQKCKDAGADEFIIKPFEAQELLDKIAQYLK